MKILICDDEQKCVDELKVHIEEYMKNHFMTVEFVITTSSKEVLESSDSFSLAFLDIQMDEADGITVAKELKKRNEKVALFFITNFEEYQDEAMDLNIFRFFEKPLDVARLNASLDKAMEYIDGTYVDIYIHRNKEHVRIPIDDIIYIVSDNRKLYIVTKDDRIVTRESFEFWREKLPNRFFYYVHKSFFVNMYYVAKYCYHELYLEDGTRIPVAPRRQTAFHKYWYSYVNRR